jgi:alkylation response protein AidB-like acyl-CoA dehydrogenase
MSDYNAPLADQKFVLNRLCDSAGIAKLPGYEEVSEDLIDAILEGAAAFSGEVLAPLNYSGDQAGAKIVEGGVVAAPGFKEAYQQYVEQGWPSLGCDPDFGGQGLPHLLEVSVMEMLQSASLSFALCPMLGQGALASLESHGSDELKSAFLAQMVSGEWTGTMNLTEPQAGSDLAAVRTKAVPSGDHFLISGQKIYITWGDHNMAGNIIHLVLARLSGAPAGTQGISLFVVPKYTLNADGGPGERNDVYAVSLEHKLGIHASPTCVMSFGDNGGAVGYLVGEQNKGLRYMFTMMNHARLNVGLQGLAVSERAYQLAAAYAKDRVQGGGLTIIKYPDIRRMLMIVRSAVEAMRAITYTTMGMLDVASHSPDESVRVAAQQRVDIMTPIVKGWCTEMANECTSHGIQIHGGMGFIEETGAAQYYRDARILAIYEGTNGIQALDLVGRKFLRDGGKAMVALIADMEKSAVELASVESLSVQSLAFNTSLNQLKEAVGWIRDNASAEYLPETVSFNLLMLAGYVTGGWQMARAALAVQGDESLFAKNKRISCQFYCDHLLTRAASHLAMIKTGTGSVMAMDEDSF